MLWEFALAWWRLERGHARMNLLQEAVQPLLHTYDETDGASPWLTAMPPAWRQSGYLNLEEL